MYIVVFTCLQFQKELQLTLKNTISLVSSLTGSYIKKMYSERSLVTDSSGVTYIVVVVVVSDGHTSSVSPYKYPASRDE